MSDKEQDFMPELVDEQVEQPSSLRLSSSKHLIQDLRTYYHRSYGGKNDRSLGYVWQRLQRQSTDATYKQTPIEFTDYYQKRREQKPFLETPQGSPHNRKVNWPVAIVPHLIVMAINTGKRVLRTGLFH